MTAGSETVQDAKQAAMRSLLAAPRTEQQMLTFLQRKGFDPQTTHEVVEWLRGYGYLDDQRYAEGRAASKARTGTGRARIRADLRQRGIAEETIDNVLSSIDPELELDAARRFAHKKYRHMAGQPPMQARRRLAAMLARRGFPADVTYTVVDEVCPPSRGE